MFAGKRLSRNSGEKISKLFSSLSLIHTCEIGRIVDTEKIASSSDINVHKLYPGNTKVILPYHNTVDLLFNWFGINCRTTDNFCFYLQNRLIQTSQTGGKWYSDTSPFSIPCCTLPWLFEQCINKKECLGDPRQLSGQVRENKLKDPAGNTKGGSITVPLTSRLTGLD